MFLVTGDGLKVGTCSKAALCYRRRENGLFPPLSSRQPSREGKNPTVPAAVGIPLDALKFPFVQSLFFSL